MKDLTKGKIGKLIITFAIPLAIGNIFQLLYSFADVFIVGNTLGNNALAAVGSTSTLNDLIVGFLIGLTNGFAVVTAQSFGAKDEKKLRSAVAHTLMLGVAVSIVLTVLSVVFLPQIFSALNIPSEHYENAYAYARIILLGMTASMAYNVCASVLRAVGDTITPLIFLIISSVLNVALDYIFIAKVNMGVEGAAYATIISQIISAVLCFVYMFKKYKMLRVKAEDFAISADMVKDLMEHIRTTLSEKTIIIKRLKASLAYAAKAFNDTIRVYEAKLIEFGLPPEELGFQLLETNTSKMPAGLVSD